MSASREVVAFVSRRNGAWLIAASGPATDDSTPDELYDAAGSLTLAKRTARDMAVGFGYTGAARWEQTRLGLFELTMTWGNDE